MPLTGQGRNTISSTVSSTPRKALAAFLAVVASLIFTVNGNLLQYLQKQPPPHVSALLNLWLCHLGGLVLFPFYLKRKFEMKVMGTAIGLSLLLLFYNYCWIKAATYLSVGVVNALFQTMIGFAYVMTMSHVPATPGDFWKLGAVLACMLGGVLATRSTSTKANAGEDGDGSVLGVAFGFLSAFLCAAYQVLYKRIYPNAKVPFTLYFSYLVSVAHVFLIPLLALLTDPRSGPFFIEPLSIPEGNSDRVLLLVTAMLACTVNFTYLLVLALSGPLMVSSAIALTVPLSMFSDYVVHGITINLWQVIGCTLILMAFRFITASPEDATKEKEEDADEENEEFNHLI